MQVRISCLLWWSVSSATKVHYFVHSITFQHQNTSRHNFTHQLSLLLCFHRQNCLIPASTEHPKNSDRFCTILNFTFSYSPKTVFFLAQKTLFADSLIPSLFRVSPGLFFENAILVLALRHPVLMSRPHQASLRIAFFVHRTHAHRF